MIDTVRWKTACGNVIDKFDPGFRLMPGKIRIIDQTLLPGSLEYIETDDLQRISDDIKRLAVRGAPAIGCAAALGLAASICRSTAGSSSELLREIRENAAFLAKSRPTAVNLFWALERCVKALEKAEASLKPEDLKLMLLKEALEILEEDISLCRKIGENGSSLLKNGTRILTHCNAGALATGGYGTALAPIYIAFENSVKVKVYADETRPLLQGARLTSWELQKAGIDVTVICDNMAADLMKKKKIDIVIVGADRIAVNGDSANKIGTYGVAVLAKYHGIPFYVAAPYSTIDFSLPTGELIPIEERSAEEISNGFGKRTVSEGIKVFNPAFDVTPAELITGIITEKGVITEPIGKNIADLYLNK